MLRLCSCGDHKQRTRTVRKDPSHGRSGTIQLRDSRVGSKVYTCTSFFPLLVTQEDEVPSHETNGGCTWRAISANSLVSLSSTSLFPFWAQRHQEQGQCFAPTSWFIFNTFSDPRSASTNLVSCKEQAETSTLSQRKGHPLRSHARQEGGGLWCGGVCGVGGGFVVWVGGSSTTMTTMQTWLHKADSTCSHARPKNWFGQKWKQRVLLGQTLIFMVLLHSTECLVWFPVWNLQITSGVVSRNVSETDGALTKDNLNFFSQKKEWDSNKNLFSVRMALKNICTAQKWTRIYEPKMRSMEPWTPKLQLQDRKPESKGSL